MILRHIMADEDNAKKFSQLIKSKDGTSNPMARLPRVGAGPDVLLPGSPASTPAANGTTPTPAASPALAAVSSSSSFGAKKVFSPNLLAKTRKEPSAADATNESRGKKKWEPRTDRGRGRGRGARGGRGRGGGGGGAGFRGANLVQSSSIFEDGVADVEKRAGCSAPAYGGGGGGDSLRESISISKVSQADPERTKEMLKKLFSDDFVARPDLQSEVAPVSLPLYVEEKGESASTTPAVGVKRKAPSLLDVLSSDVPVDDPRLLFLQLPDSLPFDLADLRHGVKQESETPSTTTTSTSTSHAEESVTEREPDEIVDDGVIKPHADNPHATTLQKLPEGQIGTVRVRASGKCELVFPNGHVFDLSLGTPSGFHQEFVSVALDEANEKGEMRSLGPVSHKVIAVPNFETLLKNSIRL